MTDSTPSVQVHVNDVVQHKSGNKRKRPASIRVQSFDDPFSDLMDFKAKYGHCDSSQTGENASLGRWCSALRCSYKEIQNNQMPTRMKLSDEQIQRFNEAGFKWSLQALPKNAGARKSSGFDKRFNDLMSFKANYGHCDVLRTGENASLASWCSSQSMVIAMFFILVRMLLLGHGVVKRELLTGSCNTIRSQEGNYLMNRFNT